MTLELKDIAFEYHRRGGNPTKVFDGLNLRINAGERVGIVGDEGVGKTTLLQLMAGLLQPTAGIVTVNGEQRSGKKSSRAEHHCGFAFQFPEQQFICETVREEILETSLALKLPGVEPMAVLRRFGFNDESILDRSPYSLSLGEARRVAIASVVATNPQAVLLDEPTVGLDMAGSEQILPVLEQLDGNITLVVASHDSNFLAEIVDKVVVLNRGQILSDSTADFFCDPERMSELALEIPEVVQCVREARGKGLNISGDIRKRKDFLSALGRNE